MSLSLPSTVDSMLSTVSRKISAKKAPDEEITRSSRRASARASTRILIPSDILDHDDEDDEEKQKRRLARLHEGPMSEIPLPKLKICILVTGTHGDVLPFCGLAHAFEDLGHSVRVATHSIHRKTVSKAQQLDFYPLAGDPKQLSEWMVQTGGNFWGDMKNYRVIPAKLNMVKDIIQSCWPAVTKVEDRSLAQFEDEDYEPPTYAADAVIANPPCIGHIHVAQALGVPLHIMFPQPWYYPTREFPHPMAGLSYEQERDMNAKSYYVAETFMWSSFYKTINRWRIDTLKLPPLRVGDDSSGNFVKRSAVPFSAMWSPSFVPKPKDWPDQCEVVGTFVSKPGPKKNEYDTTPFADLSAWIARGDKPVFIGFGSMVISDPQRLTSLIRCAAKRLNTRIVVQSGWTKLDVMAGDDSGLCHNVGPCPHDWLLPQTCAVVHHGGAGTTAAGLRHGLPTLVCPFFADQHMWAAMVHRAGVGPSPCPIDDLTEDILVEKIQTLKSTEVQQRAQELAKMMNREDGIEGGLDHFFAALPRDNMLCDVSLLLGQVKLARYRLKKYTSAIKLSVEVAAFVKTRPSTRSVRTNIREGTLNYLSPRTKWVGIPGELERHSVTNYCVNHIETITQGICSGLTGGIYAFCRAPFQFYYKPDNLARSYGCIGCFVGLLWSPFACILVGLSAAVVLFDRFVTGISNYCCGTTRLYTFDYGRQSNVYDTEAVKREFRAALARDVSDKRKEKLEVALKLAIRARAIFDDAKPNFPQEHWHFKVASAKNLLKSLQKHSSRLHLSESAKSTLIRFVSEINGDTEISFTRFCYFIAHATASEGLETPEWAAAVPENREDALQDSTFPSYHGIYCAGAGDQAV